MRKEIIFAIIAGIVFGLVLALGVWRANSAIDESSTPTKDVSVKIDETPIDGDLTISSPDNNDVFSDTPILFKGITSPNTWVAISAEKTQHTVLSDNVGEFESEVELEVGLNRILVTSFIIDQTPHEQVISVVYSSDFGNSQQNENE